MFWHVIFHTVANHFQRYHLDRRSPAGVLVDRRSDLAAAAWESATRSLSATFYADAGDWFEFVVNPGGGVSPTVDYTFGSAVFLGPV